ncbi:MAG: double zinc ribbon domain-containing protein [Anaerolineae bacterium]
MDTSDPPRRPAHQSLAGAWHSLLNWLFPIHCLGCHAPGAAICPTCAGTIRYPTRQFCASCGRPAELTRPGEICRHCLAGLPALDADFSAAFATGVLRQAIHQFKYAGQSHLAGPLADILLTWWRHYAFPVELVIPVPLHPLRERERGYNQARLLSRRFSAGAGLPHDPHALQRHRPTRPQVGLNANQRRENVAGAFTCVAPSAVAGKRILLIDDVTTTGATLASAAQALRQAGASAVSALTIARPMPGLTDSTFHGI